MKPSTLIVMSVGLIILIAGFVLCMTSQSTAARDYPDNDLFGYEGDNYELLDNGDTVRRKDFSDVIYQNENDVIKEIAQDVKVLSVTLSDVESVEIIGHQSVSAIELYNFIPGRYACQIGSGVITLTNGFEKSMIFDYLTDIVTNFNGIRRLFNPETVKTRPARVVITIDDDDLLNRIDLTLVNCKDVTVKNLTCSLDCKVSLNNSNVVFESCTFKDPEIIITNPEGGDEEAPAEVTVINHYLSLDLNMRNNSTFTTKTCRFSSIDALVNKKVITSEDVSKAGSPYTAAQIGSYVSSGQEPCRLSLDLSAVDMLYGFELHNRRDEKYKDDTTLVSKIEGFEQPEDYLEHAKDSDYPQITVNASNCAVDIHY